LSPPIGFSLAVGAATNNNCALSSKRSGAAAISFAAGEAEMDRGLSWVRGADEPPLLEITIGQALDRAAERWGDADALVSVAQGVRWSWCELAWRADDMAAGLLALGLERGDRIGIWSPNRAEWALIQFAAARIGLILTTINPAYRASELEFMVGKVGMKAVVAAERFKTSDYVAMLEAIDAPGLEHKIKLGGAARPGWLAFDDLPGLASAQDRNRARAIGAGLDCRDPINIQFTSGTTGLPKGATLSHRNILNNGWFVGRAQRLGPADRICVPVPLYHCFGMVMGNLAGVACGAAVVYPSAGFDAEATLAAVARERCTALYGVPTMFIAALDCPNFEAYDLTSLRTGIMAGSPCPIEVMKHVVERMHMSDITIAYGMTETSPVSFQSAIDDPQERRVSTIGQVQPHLEVKAIDTEGQIVPRDVPGRAVHARLFGDGRLLGRSGAHCRGDRRRRLDAHRRPGGDRRTRLRQHRRPDQGHGHPRRREHLSARDRGVPL
jgi:fatty-acyl-CoA synthase